MHSEDGKISVTTAARPVVSSRAYALIMTCPRLRQALLPCGLPTSPYDVLDYQSTLTLHDKRGMYAGFERRQVVRFVQDGVSAILDHMWGDGVLVTDYDTDAGVVADVIRDNGRRHLVLDLKRRAREGQVLAFRTRRTAMAAFTADDEWLETTIDHPVQRLRPRIVFPRARPCRQALLQSDGQSMALPIQRHADGSTQVDVVIPRPQAHVPYTIRWSW